MALRRRRLLQHALTGVGGTVAGVGVVGAEGCAHEMKYATKSERLARDGVVHIGNSTHLIVLNGVHVLTDPWLRDPADKVLQHRVPPAALPTDVDIVLITHEHEDHFDPTALALIDKKATIIVPAWMEARAKEQGFAKVVVVKAGDVVDVDSGSGVDGGLRFEVVKALHDIDEVAYRFGGTAEGAKRVFFGGDTLPNPEIASMAKKGGADFCFLPADAGALLGKRYVSNVEEAVAMAKDFGVDAAGKGAMLTHHEFELTSALWSVILDVKPVDTSKLPAWFTAPVPGTHLLFPWQSP